MVPAAGHRDNLLVGFHEPAREVENEKLLRSVIYMEQMM